MYLIDQPPKFCPECGDPKQWLGTNREEFYNGCSQVCRCGAKYQYLEQSMLLEASRLNFQGDLYYYETRRATKPVTNLADLAKSILDPKGDTNG